MAYVALYRRWRPQDFDALVGQQAVKTALANALASGRIAHAYLFNGPRGTGKTSTARILAKALNCDQGPTAHPCGHCPNCERITNGTSMDVFEIDAASNRGIDEIKALREQIAFTPVEGRYKIYIIDEVHMLTTEAFNALLKTLEEPPAHVIFILATTDPHKIPATIHSRCQRFDFRRVTVEEITQHLAMVASKSNIQADEEALRLIAIQSEGGMRDALSLLDQCGVMSPQVTAETVRQVLGIVGREALRELVQKIGQQDLAAALAKLHVLLEQGKDARQVLTELAEYLRALLLFKAAPSYQEVYLTDTAEALQASAPLYGRDRLMAAEERIHAALAEMRWTARPRITAELCLFDLCRLEGSTIAALSARVEQLETQLAQGIPVAVAPQRTPAPVAPAQVAGRVHVQTAPAAPKVAPVATPVVEPRAQQVAPTSAPVTNTPPRQASTPPAQGRAAAPAAQVGATSPQGDTGDVATGEDYWQQTLAFLKGEKKMAMVSCAKSGKVYSYSHGVLRVLFKAPFQCARMNKEDYKKVFEDVLLRLTRQSIKLDCVTADSLPSQRPVAAAPVAPAPAPAPVAPQPAPSRVEPNLQKALDVLGGTLREI